MFSTYLLLQTKFGKKKLVAARLKNFEEISIIDELHGRYDIIVRIDTEDQSSMEHFMQNNIHTIEDIQKAETLVVSSTLESERDEDEDSEG